MGASGVNLEESDMHDFRCSREDFTESWTIRSYSWRNNIFDPLSLPILEKPASHTTFITIVILHPKLSPHFLPMSLPPFLLSFLLLPVPLTFLPSLPPSIFLFSSLPSFLPNVIHYIIVKKSDSGLKCQKKELHFRG